VAVCLIAVLAPFITAMAICEGIKYEYALHLHAGADIYITSDHYGYNAPITLDLMEKLMQLQGVVKVVPRVIGRTYIKNKLLVVLGIAATAIPPDISMIEGRKPARGGGVIIGRRAAEYLNLKIGSQVGIQRNPGKDFRLVGIFQSTFSIWNADLLVMGVKDAAGLFQLEDKATDLMVHTRPGYEQIVDLIVRLSEKEASGLPPLRVQNQALIQRYSQRGFNLQAGVLAVFYCVVFTLAIPSIGILSGFGMPQRRREIGIMKATGWQTQEVLEMVVLENLLLSIITVPLVVVVTSGWIHLLNGAGLVRFFVPAHPILIKFSIPARIFPVPIILGIMLALVLTMVGSIYSTWKTAIVPPSEAMKT
jgi:ABC-type lipoprotein release transport system permease subunit